MTSKVTIGGIDIHKAFLTPEAQSSLVDTIRDLCRAAPLYTPSTRWGKDMSVRMTSAGQFGWFSDQKGYRYIAQHPGGQAWPAIAPDILAIWRQVTGLERVPECCLINFYGEGARMGLHQDRDEANFEFPVVSISLGDDALFRVGGTSRGGKTETIWLTSGDVAVMGGASRLAFHGIDRIRFGSSRLLEKGGRINLTLRVVT